MEITQEHKTQIEEIISGMECPIDTPLQGSECYRTSTFNNGGSVSSYDIKI